MRVTSLEALTNDGISTKLFEIFRSYSNHTLTNIFEQIGILIGLNLIFTFNKANKYLRQNQNPQALMESFSCKLLF
ncbi:hypothetical protein BpHYR1_015970 [Brachionus plicatilis]|uniref:Uncharacterized protein n=1 Tax=Brachionus plicatilis TaxID=10195 RepID=A0A3M7T5H1_BRAPC|nr:hypothetical protein BpHYR1_015970 [Brachionus plicatilis]